MTADVLVIGGGPAGMAAALAAHDKGADVLIVERSGSLGGILNQCIHNGFGLHMFGEELTGPEYADRYIKQVTFKKIAYLLNTTVVSISADKEAFLQNASGAYTVKVKTIIIATGCRERPRGVLNIPGTRPAGIYTAGTAQKLLNIDGFMPGKRVVILGSGDIGLIMARRMTLEGAKVEAVCEIMPKPGGLIRNVVQCLEDFGIPLYLSHTATRIFGKDRVEGVEICQVDDKLRVIEGTKKHIKCDTLLLSVGLIPENELLRDLGVQMDEVTGGAVVDDRLQTSISGIFSCGNALHVHDLADNASKEAEKAGQNAVEYLRGGVK